MFIREKFLTCKFHALVIFFKSINLECALESILFLCISEINWPEVLEAIENEMAAVKEQCRGFQEKWRDIMLGIKRVRTDTKMTSFRDVMDCHCHMKSISDIEPSCVELFKEYFAMVNDIKQKTEDLTQKLKKHQRVCSAVEGPMSDLELMLHPDFPFKEDAKFVPVSLSGAEKRSMLGFLAYIPQLLASLDKVIIGIKTSTASP